jgi:hypothetical protein
VWKTINHELQLIADCVCAATVTNFQRRYEAVSVDWDLVLGLARRHRVEGHLAEALLAKGIAGVPAVPQSVENQLRQSRQSIGLRELRLLSGLKAIKGRFDAAGIEFVLLKGLHTTSRGYGKLGIRTNHDIDLLVEEGQIREAAECLSHLGFRRLSTGASAVSDVEADLASGRKDLELYSDDLDIVVDLHWRLFENPFLLPVDAIVKTRTENLFGGCEVRVLRREANLVYLAVHGAHHGWSRLKWLADFQAVFASEPPSVIQAAFALADELGVTACLDQAMSLQRLILNAETPALPAARPSGVRTWILCWLARISIVHFGEKEIETVWGGTKAKNASHYLLKLRPRYLTYQAASDARRRMAEVLRSSRPPVAAESCSVA